MRQYVGPPTVAAIAQMLRGGVEVNKKGSCHRNCDIRGSPSCALQELLAKGVIEGFETEEEEQDQEVMNASILEVAKICNQNHFSGRNKLNVNASEWVIVQVGQLGGFPSWPSAVASRGACLTSSTAWPGCCCWQCLHLSLATVQVS